MTFRGMDSEEVGSFLRHESLSRAFRDRGSGFRIQVSGLEGTSALRCGLQLLLRPRSKPSRSFIETPVLSSSISTPKAGLPPYRLQLEAQLSFREWGRRMLRVQ